MAKSAVSAIRNAQLQRQNFKCPLCLETIATDDAVLDHCHKTGSNRAVLHRGCNAALGKVENARNINGLQDDEKFRKWCMNIPDYIEKAEMDSIHWSHKTKEEKKEAAKKRALRKKKQSKLSNLL